MDKRVVVCAMAVAVAGSLLAQPGPPGGPERHPPGLGIVGAWPAMPHTPITGAPYSAVQVTSVEQKLSDGNVIQRQSEAKVYRDSQGRQRIEHSRRAGAAQDTAFITIFDPVGGFAYSLDPAKLTAEKRPIPAGRPGGGPPPFAGQHRRAPAGAEMQEQDLGTQVIEGIPATGVRETRTIPAGAIGNQQPIQITREVWTSTALKVPVLIKSSDPRSGTATIRLTNITQAEPDAALFQVPANYVLTERSGPDGRRPGMMGGGTPHRGNPNQ